jgi:membrane protein required for colicin V production
MNYFDIIVLLIIAWFAYKGYTKGLVIELASIIALLLGIYAAFHFSVFTGNILQNKLGLKSEYLSVIAFVVTFIVVIILVFLLAKLLEGLINLVMLGFINKISGAAFSILKGYIILSILVLSLNIIDTKTHFLPEKLTSKSILYKPMLATGRFIMQWVNVNKLYPGVKDAVTGKAK